MEAYRQFQREQAAKGNDPSKAARLTQEEQADYRKEQGLTPIAPVTPSNNPYSNPAPTPDPTPAPAPDPEPEPAAPIISEPSSYTGTITDTLRSASSDYANKNQDLQPGAEMYKGDGATSTGRKPLAAMAQAKASQGATFDRSRYDQLLDNFYKVEANPDSNPADVYNALYAAAEYVAPFENNSPSPDEWIRTMSGTPEILDDYLAYVESGGATDRSMPTNPKQDSDQPAPDNNQTSTTNNAELESLQDRITELEEIIAGQSAINQVVQTNERRIGGGGLIGNVFNNQSVLTDMGSMKVGGQVYGPDGTTYATVTDAINAGVYNYTFFPISTGIRQENRPLTRRNISAPVENVSNRRSSLMGLNPVG